MKALTSWQVIQIDNYDNSYYICFIFRIMSCVLFFSYSSVLTTVLNSFTYNYASNVSVIANKLQKMMQNKQMLQ